MRIAIFSDNFYPELSGITDSLMALAEELAKAGHQVFFFAPAYSRRDFAKSGFEFKELDLGANVSIVRFRSLPYRSSPTGQSRIVLPTCWRWRILRS